MGYVGFHGEQVTSDQLRYWRENGQGFIYSTGGASGAGAAGTYGILSVFNPQNSGKSIIIDRIAYYDATAVASADPLQLTTVDPAYGVNGSVVTNARPGNASNPASVASTSFNPNTTVLPGGIILPWAHGVTNIVYEVFQQGAYIILPAGVARGLAMALFISSVATHFYGITMFGVEV